MRQRFARRKNKGKTKREQVGPVGLPLVLPFVFPCFSRGPPLATLEIQGRAGTFSEISEKRQGAGWATPLVFSFVLPCFSRAPPLATLEIQGRAGTFAEISEKTPNFAKGSGFFFSHETRNTLKNKENFLKFSLFFKVFRVSCENFFFRNLWRNLAFFLKFRQRFPPALDFQGWPRAAPLFLRRAQGRAQPARSEMSAKVPAHP